MKCEFSSLNHIQVDCRSQQCFFYCKALSQLTFTAIYRSVFKTELTETVIIVHGNKLRHFTQLRLV